MNRIQKKGHSIGTYEINKIDTFKAMDVMDLLLVIRINYKNSYLNNYSEKLFC